MKRAVTICIAAALLATAAVAAPRSGLQPGQSVPAFDVVDVSGPNKGKQLCYRCAYGGAPVAAAFIRRGAPETAEIVAGLQRLAKENRKLKTFVVVMAGPEAKEPIQRMTAEQGITIPVTFLPQGPSAPDVAKYQIDPEASNTILLWNKGVVRANFVNVTRDTWAQVERAAREMTQ